MKTVLYVARDRDGTLFLYEDEPERDEVNGQWCPENIASDFIQLDEDDFPEVSWEDPPIAVKLTRG